MDPARRSFLRGRLAADPPAAPARPPWALADDAAFTQRCTRCHDCIRACPAGILQAGDGGFPEVSFTERGCTECGACADACAPRALERRRGAAPWSWRVAIGQGCLARRRIECRVCGEACDHGAIRFRPTLGGVAQPEIQPGCCTGCGLCVAPCPSGAIRMVEPEREAS